MLNKQPYPLVLEDKYGSISGIPPFFDFCVQISRVIPIPVGSHPDSDFALAPKHRRLLAVRLVIYIYRHTCTIAPVYSYSDYRCVIVLGN